MKKLLYIAILIGLISLIARKAMGDREQWEGLTEDDLRNRLDERLPGQIPDDKRQMITDTIVTKMKDKGAIADAEADDTIDLADDLAADAASV